MKPVLWPQVPSFLRAFSSNPAMVLHEVAYAVRSLVKRPGFSAIAAATLALGIGANSAVFSVVDAVLLRPLPYPDAGRLVRVRGMSLRSGEWENLSPLDFLDLRERTRGLEKLAAYNNYADATLTGAGEPERVAGTRVTADFFGVLRVSPRIGRDFTAADDTPSASRVAILSDGFWQRRFGADPAIVGRIVRLNAMPTEVIGVLPPDFRHPFPENARQPDVYVPFRIDRTTESRTGRYLQAIGRLAAGATLADAQGDLSAIGRDLTRAYPAEDVDKGFIVVPMLTSMTASTRAPLLVLLGAVALVLLIACANLANLLLARSTSRQKEIAVRQALGASRGQLVRQLLTESVVLALAGGALAVVVAASTMRVFSALGAGRIARGDAIGLDWRVLMFTLVLSLATAVAFGVGPALIATRAGGNEALKEGGRTADGRIHRRAQHALIVSEVALALMLLVGAGLLVKSFSHLTHVDPGFRAAQVLTLQTSLPIARYPEGDEIPFYSRLEERLRALPGARAVGAVNILPLSGNYSCDGFDVAGRPKAPPGEQPCAEERSITPGYFDAMGIPLLRGRTFSAHDVEGSAPVMIVSDAMARRFWPGADAIGAQVLYQKKAWTIVGVVVGVKHLALDEEPPFEMYTPHALQPSFHTMTLAIRTDIDAAAMMPLVRRELAALDPDVPISSVRTMRAVLDTSATEPRFRTMLVGAFAALAALLSVVGVAGVTAYAVGRRRQEIGVRVALGATRANIVRMVIGEGMAPTLVGLTLGVAGALLSTRVLAGLLFGVSTVDAAVFAAATALLAASALGGTYLPARRATAIDPTIALRNE
jgi:putative ABC transport system permease protein